LDVGKFGLTGRQMESAFREAGLTVNRNAIPFDSNGPWYTSGIRMGTPALTTLGMGKEEMKEIASIIVELLHATKPAIVEKTAQPSKANYHIEPSILGKVRSRVTELLARFPLYPEIVI
jgi:glycine hydroxymethyltransferase